MLFANSCYCNFNKLIIFLFCFHLLSFQTGSHNTHFCFPQTLEAVKRLCPKRALLVGMTHEFDHHKDNEFLVEWSKREGIPVQLANDGLRIPIDL
ncbi:hypothetical protein Patl1_11170 [Pistacia atlantica]|uniref:Uncharacterized protein n=1 Tax=Pistacia atlantica TaxID=434234 RepID=A0ACC1A9H0_9ROSI|nr:hypothetical protein Patl1_11170 [Pistacia atlantica]